MRTEDAALEVMAETGAKHVWRGDPNLIHEIADRAGHKRTHPLNCMAAVLSAIAKSKKFRRAGIIEHMGRRYPLFKRVLAGNGGGDGG